MCCVVNGLSGNDFKCRRWSTDSTDVCVHEEDETISRSLLELLRLVPSSSSSNDSNITARIFFDCGDEKDDNLMA